MSLFESLNQSKEQKITPIERELNLQWILYRSALTQQPIPLVYYKKWKELYNKFYEILNDYVFNEENTNKLIKPFSCITNELEQQDKALSNILSNNAYENFSKAKNRILKGMEKITEICGG